MKATRFFSLGGMREIGKMTLVIEHEDEIAIVDAGIKFTNTMETGVRGIIPDYTYLKENQDKIVGVFITHGHEDHIGGIPYLIQQVNIERIYAPRIAHELIRLRLKEHKIKSMPELLDISTDAEYQFKHLKVDFWTSQHSIPDSFGIRVKTPNGAIFDTGDFRIDYTPIGTLTDFAKLEKIGQEGLDIFTSDSTNSMSPFHSPSEQKLIADIEKFIVEAKAKVIFTTFASNLSRIKIVTDIAVKHNRKICAFGRSMIKGIEIGTKLKYIDVPPKTFIDKKDLSKYEDKEIIILSTGSQGEEMAALSTMSLGKHPHVKLKSDDIVMFSSNPIPGNKIKVEILINQLYKLGVTTKENRIDGMLHTSGHAYQEEHKKVFDILKPKYFFPSHGAYRQSAVHGYTATKSGVKEENIAVLQNGQVVELLNHVATVTSEIIDSGPIYIDSNSFVKGTNETIKARNDLSENGFVNVIVVIDKKKNEIIGRTKIISRGAIYVKDSKELMGEIQRLAHGGILHKIKNTSSWSKSDLKMIVKNRLETFFYQKKRRTPTIITSILEVE